MLHGEYPAGSSVEGARREACDLQAGNSSGCAGEGVKCCYAFRIAFGWTWHTSALGCPCLLPTQRSGTEPVEHWRVRRALQMNPSEGEAFCLQGHSALSQLARAGSGPVWASELVYGLYNKYQAAHTSIKPTNTSSAAVEVRSLILVAPSGWTWKHRRAQFHERNS